MASAGCWKCLSRPTSVQLSSHISLNRVPVGIAAFSTSAALGKAPATAKKPGVSAEQKRLNQRANQTKTLKIKKKVPVKTGKPPMPGERKAMRKRIVLSNTNALEVPDMQDLNAEMVESEEWVGKVVGLDGKTVDGLRAAEAFKVTQGWGLFRRPGVLVRGESVALGKRLGEWVGKKKMLRLVIDGEKGTGKSLMLVWAMATAFVRGWIVVNIPEAQDLTNAGTEYAPIPNTTPTLYSQNAYAAAWLTAISKANATILNDLTLSQDHSATVPIPLQENMSLFRLCELGARDPDVSWPIFQAFWTEITAPGRPPVLMALDSLQHAMQNSAYRSADFEPIHAHDFAIMNHFMSYLSGSKTMPNGGAVLAATSRSNHPRSKSTGLALKQAEERVLGLELTKRDPHERAYDERADEVLKDVSVMKLKGLTKGEARGLMEYWAQSGVLRQRVDERTVAEKWAIAGHGVVGEIERGALYMRI